MSVTQIHGDDQIQAGTVSNGVIAASAGIVTTKLADGADFIKRTGTVPFTADQPMGTHKLTGLGDPTNPQDAATKAYVDALTVGLDVKASVRAATTTNGALSTAFENGDTIDGVTLATGDRILIKNQIAGLENGIYVVAASGAPSRATDADVSAEVTGGMFTFVMEGTVNADTGWVLTTNDPITLGTTSLTFAQFSAAGIITAGAGLVKTGSTLDVVAGDDSILVNADELHVQRSGASLELSGSGLRVKQGASGGQVYIAGATLQCTPTTLSGDVASVVNDGTVTITLANRIVIRETPSGAINGSNVTFTLASTPVAGSEEVYLNGILQEPGAGNDYTISGATITYLTAPKTGSRLRVSYQK